MKNKTLRKISILDYFVMILPTPWQKHHSPRMGINFACKGVNVLTVNHPIMLLIQEEEPILHCGLRGIPFSLLMHEGFFGPKLQNGRTRESGLPQPYKVGQREQRGKSPPSISSVRAETAQAPSMRKGRHVQDSQLQGQQVHSPVINSASYQD